MESGLRSQLQYTFLYLCKSSNENQCSKMLIHVFDFHSKKCATAKYIKMGTVSYKYLV